jgi:hypothetical protein
MLQRPGMNGAIFAGSGLPAFNQSAIPENPDVLGHDGLTAPDPLIKLMQIFVAFIQQLQNSDSHRMGDGPEQFGNPFGVLRGVGFFKANHANQHIKKIRYVNM